MELPLSSSLSHVGGFQLLFQRFGRWTEHGLLIVQQVHESFPDCVRGACVCMLNDRTWSSFGSQEEVDLYLSMTVLNKVESMDMKRFCDVYREEINLLNDIERQKKSSKLKGVKKTKREKENSTKSKAKPVLKKQSDVVESVGGEGSERVILDELYVSIVCDNDQQGRHAPHILRQSPGGHRSLLHGLPVLPLQADRTDLGALHHAPPDQDRAFTPDGQVHQRSRMQQLREQPLPPEPQRQRTDRRHRLRV